MLQGRRWVSALRYSTEKSMRKSQRRTGRVVNPHPYLVLSIAAIFSLAISAAAWAQTQSRPSEMRPRDSKEMADRGAVVFQNHCKICHFAASSEKKVGPGLRGFMKSGKRGAASRWDTATVTRLIENGGKDMPGFRTEINEAQLRDLLAYLRTL
jgi:cytochrome c